MPYFLVRGPCYIVFFCGQTTWPKGTTIPCIHTKVENPISVRQLQFHSNKISSKWQLTPVHCLPGKTVMQYETIDAIRSNLLRYKRYQRIIICVCLIMCYHLDDTLVPLDTLMKWPPAWNSTDCSCIWKKILKLISWWRSQLIDSQPSSKPFSRKLKGG